MARPMTAAQMRAALKKWGVPYREFSGWATRGRPGAFYDVRGVVIHHTGSDSQSDGYLDFLFKTGRPADGIPGPLCQVATDMDGDLWLGAVGRANHAGRGSGAVLSKVTAEAYAGYTTELKAGPDDTDGNAHFYGNEVRYDGGQPMTAKQYRTATRYAAAICDFHGWSALSVIGHREWSSRKPDPGKCPMNQFRSDVAALLKTGPGGTATQPPADVTPKPPVQEDDMPTIAEVESAVLRVLTKYNQHLYSDTPEMKGTEGVWNRQIQAVLAEVRSTVAEVNAEGDARHTALLGAVQQLTTAVDALTKAVTAPKV